MPVIYQGRCTACNATTAQFTDGCLAVYLDEPPPEVKKHSQNPHLVLIHPQDETILNQIGESITSAAEEGRLVWLELAVCRGCGRSYEIRRLSTAAAAFGLVVTLLVVLVCLGGGIGVAFLVGNNWVGWVSAIATIGALWTTFYFVLADSADRQVRSRHADRVAQLETVAQCPQCGSRDHAHPGALSEPIPCVACGGRSVVFDCVGIS